jgi:hypothetical protein
VSDTPVYPVTHWMTNNAGFLMAIVITAMPPGAGLKERAQIRPGARQPADAGLADSLRVSSRR